MSPSLKEKIKPDKLQKRPSRWEFCALFALCVILITPFIYQYRINTASKPSVVVADVFSGTASCKECHQESYRKWQGSDHDRAMAVTDETTVLGNFNDIVFTDPYTNKQSRFFREDGKFLVETEGPDGKDGIFTISYTFGFFPLQQYLIPFPGGKLQCLSIAWDIEEKQWYRLPPYEVTGSADWLHWAKGGQTWSGSTACRMGKTSGTSSWKNGELRPGPGYQ